ncbi:armadillo-type protein [Melampsora americana]|nr:armadillo-type protein [Melampsora americana]
MGKAQYKKRIRSARQQATSAPIQSNNQEQDQSNSTEPINQTNGTTTHTTSSKTKSKKSKSNQRDSSLAILDHVRSETPADRVWSIAAISNLILSSASTRRLLQSKNLVSLLIERLNLDQSHPQILIETTGALRNLVIEVGDDVCGEMYNKGILPPLQALISMLHNQNNGFQSYDLILAENLLVILWSLAETSNKLFKAIGTITELVPFLFRIIQLYIDRLETSNPQDQSSRPTTSLTLVSIQCLYTLTEDDPKLIRSISHQLNPLIALFELIQPSNSSSEEQEEFGLLKVYIIAIFRNIISQTKNPDRLSFKPFYDTKLPNHLFQFLNLDLSDVYNQASKAFLALPPIPLSDLNLAKASVKAPSSEELIIESAERRLTTLQLSLELLGEWCATLDGFQTEEEPKPDIEDSGEKEIEEEEEEDTDEDDDTEMKEALIPNYSKKVDLDGDEEMGNLSEAEDLGNPTDHQPCPMDLIPSNQFSNLFHSFIKLSQPIQPDHLPKHIIPTAQNGTESSNDMIPSTIKELLVGIQTRSLQSINNLLITLERTQSTSKILKPTDLQLSWKTVFAIVEGDSTSPLILPAVTCLWSLIRIESIQTQVLSDRILQRLLNLIDDEFINQETQARLISTLSVFGSITSIRIEQNQLIGNKLIQILNESNEPLLIIHSLDGIFDLYGDEEKPYDSEVFRKLKYLKSLIGSVPKIKQLVKKIDKRKDPKLRKLIEDGLTNLLGFIEYRQGLKF